MDLETAIALRDLNTRMTQLERVTYYPGITKDNAVNVKAQAAQIEATQNLYAPLRTDTASIVKLAAFARRLLDPEDLGHAVSKEVRNLAREALGKEKVE